MRRAWGGSFTIFHKLVVAFLLLIIPLNLISLHFIDQGKNSVKEQLVRSLESKVDYYSNLLETDMDRIRRLQREMLLDKDLQGIAYQNPILPVYDRSQMTLRIRRSLELIRGTSVYVDKINAYIPAIDRMISNSYYGSLPMEEYRAVVESVSGMEGQVSLQWNDRWLESMSYPERLLSTETYKPEIVLTVELSTRMLKQALGQMADYAQSGAALLRAEGGPLVSDGADQRIVESLIASIPPATEQPRTGRKQIVLDSTPYLAAYRYSPGLKATLVTYVAEREVFGELDAYRWWIVQLSIASVAIILLFSYWIYRVLHKPLSALVRSFRRAEQGKLEPIRHTGRRDEFGYLYEQYNQMADRLDVLIHQVYEQKLRARSSELKQLQSQINPHFLYNTYFILYRLANIEDTENVARFSSYLGEYFQYIARHQSDEVPLELEVKHTETYAKIQNIRFDDRIAIRIEPLPPEAAHLIVPKLILQPIVENAYKHGLENKREDGILVMSYNYKRGDRLTIAIEDNGSRMTDGEVERLNISLYERDMEVEGTGLTNVHRRLRLLYGEDCGIRLSVSEYGGLKVELDIPCACEEEPACTES